MSKSVILGIESSCDDTSAAIIQGNKILSNVIANQDIHRQYGGVVPELASRAHQSNIIRVIDTAIQKAGITSNQINAVAYTKEPGLIGSLLVGINVAKSLAMSWDIPLLEVNHMDAHILAHFIEDANETPPEFPFICLTVSGGHTQLVIVKDYFDMEVVGKTKDDAVGEAFDKIGKILGLPYPAGPAIDKLAQNGNPKAFTFPIPKVENYDYSYSGIKTSVLYFIQKQLKENQHFIEDHLSDLCASVQYILVESLMKKLDKAAYDFNINKIAIAGGVSANSELRKRIKEREYTHHWKTYIPKFEYTTDNAAMIAMTGSLHHSNQKPFGDN